MTSKGLALALATALSAATAAAADPIQVTISGDMPRNGIFDPSVEYGPGGATGWLSYSAVFGNVNPWGPQVETRLAKSTDRGTTWTHVGAVIPSIPDTLTLMDQTVVDGFWNSEVSSLVHDPTDPDGQKAWKLFSHRIFRKDTDNFTGNQNLPAYSWIAFQTAPQADGPWTTDVPLLSSGPLPPPPFNVVPVAVNSLHSSLASMLVYSEPGAFVRDGVLYLSLTALTAAGPDRIIVLSSVSHGVDWNYAGTPLDNGDAADLGFLSFDGSAIVEQGGRVFLLATPESPGVLHDGTLVFEFEDLANGRLVREAGVPVVRRHFPALPGEPANRRGGQADFHEDNRVGGLLQPSLQLGDYPLIFQIFSTGEPLIWVPEVPAASAGGRAALVAMLLAVAGTSLRSRLVGEQRKRA